MLNVLKKEANKTYTENGALTNRSSFSHCVDLFGSIGALRRRPDEDIIGRFVKAYAENPDLAMKILFYARDVRGGLGERRVFRTLLRWLAVNEPASVKKNLALVAEYGRWDDLTELLDTPCRTAALEIVKNRLAADLSAMEQKGEVSLLAKWLPSVNASNVETVCRAKDLARALGMTDAQYRKTLSSLRAYLRILENNLREKDYTFDYAKQPSKAMFKYRRAFCRNDGERYSEFMDKVSRGEATVHTGTLTPYELAEASIRDGEDPALDATWRSMPDYAGDENALCVIDGSGSMYSWGSPMPAAVAMSLGLYFAERNKGAFANHFITFSAHPQLVEIQGETLFQKLQYCARFNEVANTNIQAVFDLILETAVKHNVPQSELPTKLFIISDMEFDSCAENADLTNFQSAARRYAAHGYELPQLVFWNVDSRHEQVPVTVNDRGVALVSGCTPRIFSMAMAGELDPYGFMMSVIGSERYAPIAA